MGERAWMSIRYRGTYYTLYSQWAPLEGFGEWLVQLLTEFSDPEHWKSLVENATVILTKRNDPPPPPPVEFIDKLRGRIMASKEEWSYLGEEFMKLLEIPDQCTSEEVEGWDWNVVTQMVSRSPRCYHLFLELGMLLTSEDPCPWSPQMDINMDYIYTIDLDQRALFVTSHRTIQPGLHFKLGSIPKNWLRILHLPLDWVEMCYAYTPTVEKLLLTKLEEDDILSLVFDKLSSLTSFKSQLFFFKAVRSFFFSEPQLEEPQPLLLNLLSLEYYEPEGVGLMLDQVGVDALALLMRIYSVPSPFAAFKEWNQSLEVPN